MTIDTKGLFWKEWMHKNNADHWGAPSDDKPDDLKIIIGKACDWIKSQGQDPDEVARTMLLLGMK
ncbi:hypothetical protein QFC21_004833 [Naganishia friedmannii]|uniref:Uncharacterized protein n=1 Tax=Naganishia friedmannii TaxID=89922 RepID=A0ACC2VCQ2_9TREE|nr:hypothetical protein QFC21_004833 [Naganishia friedmannii]